MRVTVSNWPTGSVTRIRHSHLGSAAAAWASSRAVSAVIAPIRVTCPGSPDCPAKVRHGTLSAGRPSRVPLAGPVNPGTSPGPGMCGQHQATPPSPGSPADGNRLVLSGLGLGTSALAAPASRASPPAATSSGSGPLSLPLPLPLSSASRGSASLPGPPSSPGSPPEPAPPPPSAAELGGPWSLGPGISGGCGSVPSSRPMNTCARSRSMPPPARGSAGYWPSR